MKEFENSEFLFSGWNFALAEVAEAS